jgi:hypothetical protein
LWTADSPVSGAVWNSISTSFVIPADTLCWFGLSATTTGTTAGFRTPQSPVSNSMSTTSPPGNLSTHGPRYAQVALTNGVWTDPLPTLVAAAFATSGTTGTLPIVFADNNSAA